MFDFSELKSCIHLFIKVERVKYKQLNTQKRKITSVKLSDQ